MRSRKRKQLKNVQVPCIRNSIAVCSSRQRLLCLLCFHVVELLIVNNNNIVTDSKPDLSPTQNTI